jgi:hypothetical protein
MPVVSKTEPVKSKSEVVGQATFPVFDEKNPSIGLSDVMSYDWKAAGYQGPEHAIVCLVNTQHATNIKNEIRSKANPKLTQEKLNQLTMVAMAALPVEELQAMQNDPAKIMAKAEEIKAKIKADYEEKAKAAAASVTEDGTTEE